MGGGGGGPGRVGRRVAFRWSLEMRLESPASSSLLSLVSKEVSIHTRDLHPRSADLVRLRNPPGAALGASSAWKRPQWAAPGTETSRSPRRRKTEDPAGSTHTAGHGGACFSPGRAQSLVLLPFLSWTRRQMSGKFVHIDFLNCPHPEDGEWGTRYPLQGSNFQPCTCIRPPGER